MDSYVRFQTRAGLVIVAVYAGFLVWMTDGLTLGQHSPQALLTFMAAAFVAGAALFALAFLVGVVGRVLHTVVRNGWGPQRLQVANL